MGLLDQLRMSTGLALEPVEAYVRAFEKGVLLGPTHFGVASDLFRAAVPKLESVDAGLAARAAAHSSIYAFLALGDPRPAADAVARLQHIPWVETPGTIDELMEGPRLGAELAARIEEIAAASAGATREAGQARWRAAYAWLPLGSHRPVTFAFFGDDGFTEDALSRFFLQAGLAARADGDAFVTTEPERAAEQYAMATQAFARCGADALRTQTRDALRLTQAERRCWFCGVYAQGVRSNISVISTGMINYLAKLANADPLRRDSLAPGEGIFCCATCSTVVDSIADAKAQAVRHELLAALLDTRRYAEALELRLRAVESRMRVM